MMDFNAFEQFDAAVDLEGLKSDIASVAANDGERKELPTGEYEVRVEKMELTFSKKSNDPMFTCWMRVVAGEYQNQMVFYNQIVTKAFQLHLVNQFMESMGTGLPIQFERYHQYAQLIQDVFGEIEGKKEFALVVGERKGFPTYTITQVFSV